MTTSPYSAANFWLQAFNLDIPHTSWSPRTQVPGIRRKLQSRFGDQVLRFFVNGAIQDAEEVRKQLHTEYVDSNIRSRPPNRVLNLQPPDIAEEETSLPRQYRSALSQLRSGHCSALNTYRHRIGITDTYTCPSCQQSPHDTHHIFTCPSNPTTLGVSDLWERPAEVSDFLATLPFFRFRAPPRPPELPPPAN